MSTSESSPSRSYWTVRVRSRMNRIRKIRNPQPRWTWVPVILFLLFFCFEPLNLDPDRYLVFALLCSVFTLLRWIKSPPFVSIIPGCVLIGVSLLPLWGAEVYENPLEYSTVVFSMVM